MASWDTEQTRCLSEHTFGLQFVSLAWDRANFNQLFQAGDTLELKAVDILSPAGARRQGAVTLVCTNSLSSLGGRSSAPVFSCGLCHRKKVIIFPSCCQSGLLIWYSLIIPTIWEQHEGLGTECVQSIEDKVQKKGKKLIWRHLKHVFFCPAGCKKPLSCIDACGENRPQ